MNKEKKVNLMFSALDPYIETNIVLPTEKEIRGCDWIEWGERNIYPKYIFDLYQTVPSLHSIISSVVDYVKGNEVKSNIIGLSDVEASELVEAIALQYCIYGNCALNVLRNRLGKVARVDVLDMKNVRSNRKNEIFYYSEDFNSKSYGRIKHVALPKFDETKTQNTSIHLIKANKFTTYAQPLYGASLTSCEVEKHINEYQLNEITNGFASNVMISFTNGTPTDEVREEIEDMINDKFSGYQNAGRPIISFSQDKEHAPEVLKLDVENFSDKYNATSTRAREEIFASWRINKNLVGISTDNIGFSKEEFNQTFALANKTVIQPIQKKIVQAISFIYGVDDAIVIEPFSLDIEETQENVIDSGDIENNDINTEVA